MKALAATLRLIRYILEILLVVLVVLKLFKVISISWLWVIAPFWIPLALAIGYLGISLIFGQQEKNVSKKSGRNRRMKIEYKNFGE